MYTLNAAMRMLEVLMKVVDLAEVISACKENQMATTVYPRESLALIAAAKIVGLGKMLEADPPIGRIGEAFATISAAIHTFVVRAKHKERFNVVDIAAGVSSSAMYCVAVPF